MKTYSKIIGVAFFFLTLNFIMAQEGENRLNECKSLTIKMYRGESLLQSKLTDCLVSLATLGSDYTTKYTDWANDLANQSKEAMDAELNRLESDRQASKEIRQQSFSNMVNGVSTNLQNQLQRKNVGISNQNSNRDDPCNTGIANTCR
ncbi:hypothetical protein [Chryseobacterium gwangjuense]|uniref:hypothetical protein n=1 Tax=Chryseobacterium gwangjuense TaxID=1069980 RepID=UPI001E57D1E2|nr:hypothetical protein [Chryseobacterium gwangjuense]MCE3076542.1 hypothetical protein [Chryseobacterium gwangjuense]